MSTNQSNMWSPDTDWNDKFAYKPVDDMVLNTEQLTYQQTTYGQPNQPQGQQHYKQGEKSSAKMAFFYDQRTTYSPQTDYNFTPAVNSAQNVTGVQTSTNFDDEPPLLEELGIEPDKIFKKVMVVLDPFKSSVPLGDYDLAGPLAFCLMLAMTMLVSGGKINFGYIYGLAVIGCIMMYGLLWLMTSAEQVTVTSVASVLGYCILPVVLLSFLGIFFNLRTPMGYMGAVLAVLWASLAASRMFVSMSFDMGQRPLIAYPCALLYGVFTLLVIF